jgi:hypothetical protein
MPRFYLHIRQDVLLEDPDGVDVPDLEAARLVAAEDAPDLIAERIRLGRPVDAHVIEIADENGARLDSVKFEDVIKALIPWL